MTRFFRPGRLVIYALVIRGVFSLFDKGGTYTLDETIRLDTGETISGIYEAVDTGWIKTTQLKRFMKEHGEEVESIQPGSYVFSGRYTASELLQVFLDGPQTVYEHLTILEGWSIYDIDAYLVKKIGSAAGGYKDFVTDSDIITRYSQRYDFLAQATKERGALTSLEGYLYPDTYFVDLDKNVIDQLVYLQLEAFQAKVWEPYGEQLLGLTTRLQGLGFEFKLSTYGGLILASIVEKEERTDANRPEITSVFFNRLQDGMQIDADISLCYGLGEGYETCTPAVIVENLYDKTNPYNTRAVGGLPPTPIVSPTASSIRALVTAEKSSNYFYLHDPQGGFHPAKNLAEHNLNKSKYLR